MRVVQLEVFSNAELAQQCFISFSALDTVLIRCTVIVPIVWHCAITWHYMSTFSFFFILWRFFCVVFPAIRRLNFRVPFLKDASTAAPKGAPRLITNMKSQRPQIDLLADECGGCIFKLVWVASLPDRVFHFRHMILPPPSHPAPQLSR